MKKLTFFGHLVFHMALNKYVGTVTVEGGSQSEATVKEPDESKDHNLLYGLLLGKEGFKRDNNETNSTNSSSFRDLRVCILNNRPSIQM